MIANYIPFILIPFIGWGVWYRLKKRNEWTQVKKASFFIGIIAFFLTEVARSFYRPYIYENDLFDYYIADTIGNSLGTVTAIFMILTLSGNEKRSDWKLILLIIIGLVFYELTNPLTNHPMDIRDIAATLIFGGLSFLVYFFILKRFSPKESSSN